jgi:hypothetical protein
MPQVIENERERRFAAGGIVRIVEPTDVLARFVNARVTLTIAKLLFITEYLCTNGTSSATFRFG